MTLPVVCVDFLLIPLVHSCCFFLANAVWLKLIKKKNVVNKWQPKFVVVLR